MIAMALIEERRGGRIDEGRAIWAIAASGGGWGNPGAKKGL